MARTPDSNDDDSNEPTPTVRTDDGGEGQPTARNDQLTGEDATLVDRRDYMRILGGTAAAVAGLGAAASAGAAGSYETVTLGEGETFTRSLGDGDTLENVLIDVTATDADVHISASGSGWTIRNVGIRGAFDIGDDSPGGDDASYEGGYGQVFNTEVSDSGGSGLIENVYVGEGIEPGVDKTCMNVGIGHQGHMDVRNVTVGGFSTTCFYISGFGREQTGGTMTIEDSYFANSSSAHIRPAGNVTIRNCVITNTNEVVYLPRTFGGLEQAITSRGIWTSYDGPTTTVENCDIDIREANTGDPPWDYSGPMQANAVWASDASVDLVDCEVRGTVGGNVSQSNTGSNPDVSLPDSCPSSAEDAAGGSGSSGGSGGSGGSDEPDTPIDPNGENTIRLSGGSKSNQIDYAIHVEDSIEKGSRANSEESVDGTTAQGYVIGGTDSFVFQGDVTGFASTGELSIEINGTSVDPSILPEGELPEDGGSGNEDPADDGTALERTIEITGGSPSNLIEYTVEVSEALELGPNGNDEDSVSGTTATGGVAGGADDYGFEGEVTAFSASGDVTVTIDGEEVDPDGLGDDSTEAPDLSRTISVSGGSQSNAVEYTFDVTQAIAEGPNANSEDGVSGTTASGLVVGGTDDYEFAGEIASFDATGDLTITIDGEEVDQADLGDGSGDGSGDDSDEEPPELDRTLTLSGGSQSNQVDYSFTVSEAVQKGERANSEESVSGTSASGYVVGGTDSFDFAGEIASFSASGDLTITVDGEEVDQAELGDDGGAGDDSDEEPPELDRTLRISGGSQSNQVDYSFAVSEAVQKGDRANSEESVSGTSASGYVVGGTDSFDFAGDVTAFEASGDVELTIDGESVDPGEFGGSGDDGGSDGGSEEPPELTEEIRISGGSQSNQVDYSFTVSEAVQKGDRANSEESVSGTSASGYVVGGTDSFDFAGEITSFESSGDLTVTVNGDEVDL